MGKGNREQEGAANGYRLDGFLAPRWGLAPCAARRPRSQPAEFARPRISAAWPALLKRFLCRHTRDRGLCPPHWQS